MATLEQAKADGYERVRMHSEQLAIGRAGRLWYLLDMVGDRPSQLGMPDPARWMVVEQADTRIRRGDYL